MAVIFNETVTRRSATTHEVHKHNCIVALSACAALAAVLVFIAGPIASKEKVQPQLPYRFEHFAHVAANAMHHQGVQLQAVSFNVPRLTNSEARVRISISSELIGNASGGFDNHSIDIGNITITTAQNMTEIALPPPLAPAPLIIPSQPQPQPLQFASSLPSGQSLLFSQVHCVYVCVHVLCSISDSLSMSVSVFVQTCVRANVRACH